MEIVESKLAHAPLKLWATGTNLCPGVSTKIEPKGTYKFEPRVGPEIKKHVSLTLFKLRTRSMS
jgi:hypothetical protein